MRPDLRASTSKPAALRLVLAAGSLASVALGIVAGSPAAALPTSPPKRPAPVPLSTQPSAKSESGIVTLRASTTDRVRIRGGSFVMGSDPLEIAYALASCRAEPAGEGCQSEYFNNEYPAHSVRLHDYQIGRREITVAQYERCVGAGICTAAWYAAGGKRYEVADYPVTMVTWQDSVTYCHWIGGRLPTEAEWERAARGPTGRRYPWGDVYDPFIENGGRFSTDSFDDRDGFAELAPVGSFPDGRTPDGIDDLAGNVDEWVFDLYGDYPEGPVESPKGPSSGDEHVLRGGSFGSGAAWLRGAARGHDLPSARRFWRGFRCAWDVTPGS